ncbi:MAG: 23S rRNA (guanosine(2251)-2'-O)-methyltransferase RlmB [Pseudomonadota bacterium]
MTISIKEPNSEWVWGKQSVLEVLKVRPEQIKEVIMSSPEQDPVRKEIFALCAGAGIPVAIKDRRQIDRILPVPAHQAVIARIKVENLYTPLEILLAEVDPGRKPPPILLALDHINDPQNLGAMIRTAHCAGVQGILLPKDRSCPVSGTVRKAAAGALEHMTLVQVVNLARALELLKEKGFWILSLEADSQDSLYNLDLRMPLVVVVGGESKGVSPLVRKRSDWVVSIPMQGAVSSLNASVACAVVLYEIWRQNH